MAVHVKSCSNDTVLKHVEDGLKILQHYAWLLDCFVLDFFTNNHWEKLPIRWRKILDDIELDELGSLLDYRCRSSGMKRVFPLSFLSLRSASHQLSLSRSQIKCPSVQMEMSSKCSGSLGTSCGESSFSFDNSVRLLSEEVLGNEFLSNPQYSHVFVKHVKPKKRHEIALMAKITAETARASGCNFIVDIGSGLGHLARTLAYGYGFNVCCLEAQDSLSFQARKLDLELELTLSKYFSSNEMPKFCRPVHLNKILDISVNEKELIEELQSVFDTQNESFKFGIVGLHPCGDLGPILLNLFTKCAEARFINIVGCCYMKLSTPTVVANTKRCPLEFRGYPLSNFIAQQPHGLSYEAREIACHAIENYMERLCNGDFSHLKIHCYRATLEKILVKHWPHLRHSGIRSIRNAWALSFDKYCSAAMQRLGVSVSDDELNSEETMQDLSQWKRVVVLYSLRLLLAPLVETILLLDRLFYIKELGLNGMLIPVFDPTLSPRNHILIATKDIDL